MSSAYDHGSASTSLAHRMVPSLRRMLSTNSVARSTIGHKRSMAARSSVHCQWCQTPAATYAQTLESSFDSFTDPSEL